ncbi:hypothetical protein ACJIZ3_024396 [Penstemon smallii]|uniref:BZIP domain-containing protein n=1 Tax=Penstemon smallii TaxID=265156 RepID=A0ABD3TSP3_9LAMI
MHPHQLVDKQLREEESHFTIPNMVATDSEKMSHGEVESPLQSNQQHFKNQTLQQSLARQSSIYSLTLDEFQHTLSDSGKNFGSMNMDEFLNSIWTAEENQAQAHTTHITPSGNNTDAVPYPLREINTTSKDKGIAKQPSLTKQGSINIPELLCRKTVDEVWSEIHNNQPQKNDGQSESHNPNNTTQSQHTFGEMTLEDFLVRAGIVREQNQGAPVPPQQPPYGIYQNTDPTVGSNFAPRPVIAATYQAIPHSGQGAMKRGGGYPGVNYGGRMGIVNGGGFGQVQGLGMGSPVSPVSSDGLCANQVESGNQYGLDMGGIRSGGRKRIIDGPVEKVVERRQRRMIKNRESAARSRARKQAELERKKKRQRTISH